MTSSNDAYAPRLHRSADDPEALAVAGTVAGAIVSAQGAGGQWWWHFDSRSASSEFSA